MAEKKRRRSDLIKVRHKSDINPITEKPYEQEIRAEQLPDFAAQGYVPVSTAPPAPATPVAGVKPPAPPKAAPPVAPPAAPAAPADKKPE